jgi:hypothetical protein
MTVTNGALAVRFPSGGWETPQETSFKWKIGQEEIHFNRQGKELTITSGTSVDPKHETLSSDLYDADMAVEYVRLFQKVIAHNLETYGCQKGCFLPFLCANDWIARPGKSAYVWVGLFVNLGREDTSFRGVTWGVVDQTNQRYAWLKADPLSGLAREFVLESPIFATNRAQFIKPLRLKIQIHINPDNLDVLSVALKSKSIFNDSVLIDKDHWAITLISANCATSLCGYSLETGHAMLAYEGVTREDFAPAHSPFVKCVHIKLNAGSRDRAFVEFRGLPREQPFIPGRTYSVAKDTLEKMLQNVTGTSVDFSALSGNDSHRMLVIASRYGMGDFFMGTPDEVRADLEHSRRYGSTNCLDWCQQRLREVGISPPSGPSTPHAYVRALI